MESRKQLANNPKILDRLVSQLKLQGHDEASAFAIATSALERSGNLDKQGNATAKGLKRGLMSPAQRAITRAAATSNHPASHYKYNPKTNRATLKRGR